MKFRILQAYSHVLMMCDDFASRTDKKNYQHHAYLHAIWLKFQPKHTHNMNFKMRITFAAIAKMKHAI